MPDERSDPVLFYEWGVREQRGTVLGPLPEGEARRHATESGLPLLRRPVCRWEIADA